MHHPTDRIAHTTAFVTPVVEHSLEREIAQWVHPMKDRSDDPSHHERTLLPRSYISLPDIGEKTVIVTMDLIADQLHISRACTVPHIIHSLFTKSLHNMLEKRTCKQFQNRIVIKIYMIYKQRHNELFHWIGSIQLEGNFYLMTHSTYFIYGYMASESISNQAV